MTRPLALSLCRNEFPQGQKIVRQVKCLLGETRAGSESHILVVVWITHMGHFFQASCGQFPCFAWFWVHIWFISGSSPVSSHSLSQDGFWWRGLWVGWHHLLWGVTTSLLTPRSVSAHVRSERSPWPWEWETCGLLPGQGSLLEYLSTGDKLQLLSPGPVYLLPQFFIPFWIP